MKQCDPPGKQEPGAIRSKTPGSPTFSMSGSQAPSNPQLPLNSGELSRGDLSCPEDADTLGTGLVSGLKPVEAQEKQSVKEPTPTPTPFVPFSGGGQRLGGPSGFLRPLTSPSAKSPKVFSSSGGPSEPKKLKPGEESQQEPELELVRGVPGLGLEDASSFLRMQLGLVSWGCSSQGVVSSGWNLFSSVACQLS